MLAQKSLCLEKNKRFQAEKILAIGAAQKIQANNCHHIETVKFVEKPLQMAYEAI